MLNKTVLITGAARRIGRHLALSLAGEGWDVAVHYRDSQAEAESVCAAIAAMGRRAVMVRADLCDQDAAEGVIPEAVAQLGRLDALIHNASLFERDDLNSMARASWQRHMDVHAYALLQLSRAMAHHCEEAAHGGQIIAIADALIFRQPSPQFLSYTLSKFAMMHAVSLLAPTLAPRLRINAVAPGMTLPNSYDDEAVFNALIQRTPMQRPCSLDDLAAAVRFLLASDTVTGEVIRLG